MSNWKERFEGAKAEAQDMLEEGLTARQFTNLVVVEHADRSCAMWWGAFVHPCTDPWFLFIFTEHHGHFVYPRDEVDVKTWPLSEVSHIGTRSFLTETDPTHWPRLDDESELEG